MKIEGKLDAVSLVQKFKHGLRTLADVKLVSASGFHLVSLVGLLGLSGLILAVRDGKIRNTSSYLPRLLSDRDGGSLEELWVVPGLHNLGNNCFLNVILQALASCSCFQSFLASTVEECESLLGEEWGDSLPLTVALASLMEELGNAQRRRTVLSPRKLMLVMEHYLSSFNLANQQDAEEAFFHLLSSLREEVSSCYVPSYSSLADATGIPSTRILAPNRGVEQSLQERWRRCFLGPFDGILGSNLTCESCSFQISLDFQFFHSLHLPPVHSGSGNLIMPGCSLEDCLKQFFMAERLENYCCSHCWHAAAIKYLALMEETEMDIGKVKGCCAQDSCGCKKLPSLEELPWLSNFSRTFKQLSIARSPKILCIHLQRASMNTIGNLVKLQGHISFPLILDLFPFLNTGMGENLQNLQVNHQQCQYPPYSNNNYSLQFEATRLSGIFGRMGKGIYSKAVLTEKLGRSAFEISGNTPEQAFRGEPGVPHGGAYADAMFGGNKPMPTGHKVGDLAHSELHIYRLVSVVEHFGRSGSGHYTVYRRVRTENEGKTAGQMGSALSLWFCISDSEVHVASEKDVLAAEASVLFYEKISENTYYSYY